METAEFNRLVEDAVRQLLPRIPEKYRSGFEGIFTGGEHWMAVEDLIYVLVDHRVLVKPHERDTLRQLVGETNNDADLLTALDELILDTKPTES